MVIFAFIVADLCTELSIPLVYRQCKVSATQAMVICNFLKKKIVTDFMVFLDLLTGKKFIDECITLVQE